MLTETLLKIRFSVIGRCSLMPTSHWLQGKCTRIILSQVASGMILQNTGGILYAFVSIKIPALGSFKQVEN
jgi:hypothetical protein